MSKTFDFIFKTSVIYNGTFSCLSPLWEWIHQKTLNYVKFRINLNVIDSKFGHLFDYVDSFPNFYRYFPETNDTKAIFVMELFGKTLSSLWIRFRPFHPVAVMQIAFQMVSTLLAQRSVDVVVVETLLVWHGY